MNHLETQEEIINATSVGVDPMAIETWNCYNPASRFNMPTTN
jgi:hypothetical protein